MQFRLIYFGFIFLQIITKPLFAQYKIQGTVVDKSSSEPLPYATVYAGLQSALTNEQGQFILLSDKKIEWVAARYLGYQTDTNYIASEQKNVQLKLNRNEKTLNQITVSAKEDKEPYKQFIKALRSLNNTNTIQSKSFFRSYTLVDEQFPAELFEAYYNIDYSKQKIQDLKLKAGHFLLPKQTSFLNISSTAILEIFEPFSYSDGSIFPKTPLSALYWRPLKDEYKIQMSTFSESATDTLIQFKFKGRDTINTFGGNLIYNTNKNTITKINLQANHATNIPMRSLADSNLNRFKNLSYNIEIGYETYKNKQVPKYILMDLNFDKISHSDSNHLTTSLKLVFYDYEQSFQLPIFRSIVNLSDYQQIAYFPYNTYFFERNTILLESEREHDFKKRFDSIPCFNSVIKNEAIPFLPKRYLTYTDKFNIDMNLISDKPNPLSHHRNKNYKYEAKKALWDSVFGATLIYLDYDCYPDTVVIETTPMLDYNYSYLVRNTSNPKDTIANDYLRMFLEVSKLGTSRTLWEARQRFKRECPTEENMLKLYDKFNQGCELDIYNLYCNANNELKYKLHPSMRRLIDSNLKYAKSMIETK
jgi:hypothetical protein